MRKDVTIHGIGIGIGIGHRSALENLVRCSGAAFGGMNIVRRLPAAQTPADADTEMGALLRPYATEHSLLQ
jgi:hypothetical protein